MANRDDEDGAGEPEIGDREQRTVAATELIMLADEYTTEIETAKRRAAAARLGARALLAVGERGGPNG